MAKQNIVPFRLKDDELAAVKQAAADEDRAVSAWVRMVVLTRLRSEGRL
jgi:hypothetical protein